jgi:hypothetical protein
LPVVKFFTSKGKYGGGRKELGLSDTAYVDGQFIAGTKGRITSFSLSHYVEEVEWVSSREM